MVLSTALGPAFAEVVDQSDSGLPVYEFHSIPYARAKRFEKPERISSYPKEQPINRPETVCFPQRSYPLWANVFLKHHMMRPEFLPLQDTQTEDAFVVNIWTDDLNGQKPVVVFLHGGGEGSGTVPIYRGAHLAKHGIVAVTVTYRIGNFGYLPYFDHGSMVANLAYYDQQAALCWVRENIAHFGGDAHNITLMGHCGGALSSLYQLLNPISNKQFDRLILFTGNLPCIASRADASGVFDKTLKAHHLQDPDALKHLPAKALIGRHNPIAQADVVDGDFFIDDPDHLLSSGQFPSMPVLLGTTADEFSMIEIPMMYRFLGITTKERNLDAVLSQKYGSYGTMLKDALTKESSDPVDLQTKIMELLVFHNSTYQMMKVFAEKMPVYGYRLHYVPALYHGLRGSYHGAELALFFDNMDQMHVPIPAENRQQTAILQNDWLSFIKTGQIPGRVRFDETSLITDYDTEITSIPFPHNDLIEIVQCAGLCQKARSDYQKSM
ncbi:MAG: carboxylesterase family protein [Lachnospiraceae bacterium]|nr:carboxylesterase family protein [Lachnospiraceae bacterium]